MDRYVLVMIGAAVGGLSRYALATAITERFGGTFPLGTLFVNLSGSFLIGLLMTLMAERWVLHPNWRLLLVVGVLGGYTTSLASNMSRSSLVRGGLGWSAILNAFGSVILGYVAVWFGAVVASRV